MMILLSKLGIRYDSKYMAYDTTLLSRGLGIEILGQELTKEFQEQLDQIRSHKFGD